MPIKRQCRRWMLTGILVLTALTGCTLGRGAVRSSLPAPDAASLARVSLPTPGDKEIISYLGLNTAEPAFSLQDIHAEIIVVEIFDMYCAYCQKAAPEVNRFFNLIEQRGYRERIKFVGIGKRNTQFEINTFRDEYGLEFPIFFDPNGAISANLPNDNITPFFYVIARATDGTLSVLARQGGGLPSAEALLNAILKAAGWETNPAAADDNQNNNGRGGV